MCLCVLSARVPLNHLRTWCQDDKKSMSEPLGLEFQVAVSPHVCGRNSTQALQDHLVLVTTEPLL